MPTFVSSPARDRAASLEYWTRLGFAVRSDTDDHCVVADAGITLVLDPRPFARPALGLMGSDWDARVPALRELTGVMETDYGFLTSDPSGAWIELRREFNHGSGEPAGSSALGTFAGMSLEMVDVVRGRALYEALGFVHTKGDLEQGWVSLAHPEGLTVSLMKPFACPHSFVNPSLTYFNGGNNPSIIADLRARGVPFAEEVTVFNDQGEVDNVILRDPGGLGVFVFND
ncbi:MAG: hypothetical protein AAGA48_20865 [Myxococcota bacterium]